MRKLPTPRKTRKNRGKQLQRPQLRNSRRLSPPRRTIWTAVPLSYSGLINQLEYEGFSEEAAVFAADLCGADWNEQAARQAEILSDFPDCSRSELIRDLENAGFTEEQAEYGAAAAGY